MSHLHASGPEKCVEIDEHVCLQPFGHSNAPAGTVLNTPEADAYGDHLGGFILGHDRAGFDVRCEGAVHVCGHGGNNWTMTGTLAGGDLTLSPSILCRLGSLSAGECGFHGFVRDGGWVPA